MKMKRTPKRGKLALFALVLGLLAWLACGSDGEHWGGKAFAEGVRSEPAHAAKHPKTSPPPAKSPAPGVKKATAQKLVALTFDDGPDAKITPRILDILQAYHIPGTFFLVGKQVQLYPKTAARIAAEGHGIGNHSWSHPDLTKLSGKAMDDQVRTTQLAISKATGYTPDLMRAPYGNISTPLLAYLHRHDLKHVYWTVDTRDWAGTPVADMRSNVRKNTHPGGIILMHSFGGRKNALEHTIVLLPLIIEDLKKAGYTFVTVDEMIAAGQAKASVIR